MAAFVPPKTVPRPTPNPFGVESAPGYWPNGNSGVDMLRTGTQGPPQYIAPLPEDRNKAIQDAITGGMATRLGRVASQPVAGTQEYTDAQTARGRESQQFDASRMLASGLNPNGVPLSGSGGGSSLSGLAAARDARSFDWEAQDRARQLMQGQSAGSRPDLSAALAGQHFAQAELANTNSNRQLATNRQNTIDDRASANIDTGLSRQYTSEDRISAAQDAALQRQHEEDDRAAARNRFQGTDPHAEANQYNLKGLLTSITGSSGGSVSAPQMSSYNPGPQVSMPSYTPAPQSHTAASAPMATIAPVDTSSAQRAAFSRAKDEVGQETSGSLAALRSVSGARGMGGGVGRGGSRVIERGLGELADVSRAQAIQKADLDTDVAKTNYGGQIAQRGQDINREASQNSLAEGQNRAAYEGAIAQRGQDIAAGQNAMATQNQAIMAQYQAQVAQRSQALNGLISALSGGTSLY